MARRGVPKEASRPPTKAPPSFLHAQEMTVFLSCKLSSNCQVAALAHCLLLYRAIS